MSEESAVVHNASQERYEIHVGDEVAGFTEAHPQGDGTILFSHTIVFDAFEDRGLASRLVAGALDDIRSRDLKIKPTCSYVLSWLERHPDYQDLVAQS